MGWTQRLSDDQKRLASIAGPADQVYRMKIRIQYRDQHSGPWTTSVVEASQIPAVGEFLAPAPIKVFRVVLVLHVLFDADYDAEVFAELIDFEDVQTKALGEVVWGG